MNSATGEVYGFIAVAHTFSRRHGREEDIGALEQGLPQGVRVGHQAAHDGDDHAHHLANLVQHEALACRFQDIPQSEQSHDTGKASSCFISTEMYVIDVSETRSEIKFTLDEDAYEFDALILEHFDGAHVFDEAIGARVVRATTNRKVVERVRACLFIMTTSPSQRANLANYTRQDLKFSPY